MRKFCEYVENTRLDNEGEELFALGDSPARCE